MQSKIHKISIKITLQDVQTTSLMDSGSTFSCINETWYERNKDQLGRYGVLPTYLLRQQSEE